MAKVTKVTVTTKKPEGFGLSDKGPGKAPQIRHNRPEVAKHCARMIIAKNMDYEAAVSKMLAADYPEATEAQIVSLARTLEASPHVRRELQEMLEEIGCDQPALKRWLGLLWAEAHGRNDKRWASAMRLLGEALEQVKKDSQHEKIPSLKMVGMDDGLKQLLGDAAPGDESTIEVEDDDAGTGDIQLSD
jgi:hypothetical protein